MMAPGGGAGNAAAAGGMVKAILDPLHKILAAVPPGSKEYKAVLKAINALMPVFGGGGEGDNLKATAASQLMKGAQSGASPLASVAPGLSPAPMPAPGAGGGAPPEASPMPMAA